MARRPRNERKAQAERNDDDLRNNPPVLIWTLVPNSGGLRIATYVHDPQAKPGPRTRPPCECNLYGSPRRRHGPHHGENCPRRTV